MVSDYYKLKLLSFEDVAKDIRHFVFEPNRKFDFNPGNYVIMFNNRNPKTAGLSRPFTIVSIPSDDAVEFIIKKVGVFTTELFNLKVGDELDIEAPFGVMNYTKEEYGGKKIIYIAGGTGITPFFSIRKFIKENNLKTDLKLFYAVKNIEDAINREEIKQVKHKLIVSSEGKRIDQEFLKNNMTKEELDDSYIFVCGPPPMEKAIEEALNGLGAKNIIREKG